MDAEEIRYKYMPTGAINLKLEGGGNGKPQYDYEKKIMRQMLDEYATLRILDVSNSVCDDNPYMLTGEELDRTETFRKQGRF